MSAEKSSLRIYFNSSRMERKKIRFQSVQVQKFNYKSILEPNSTKRQEFDKCHNVLNSFYFWSISSTLENNY